ncbi:hypothetical protein DV704_04550 [Meiothermus sp. QL-1]|uniref:hypothetical protein n=1 Tax=Meiothermus sp. QL-1 TaxID=2058095 RepID=UPI000E0CB1AE|nr:hypothetical protein [Meiothermus sp. QL-1]RDI96186.1 hypothetical protein DV704_04550 [Meiothermus sp. QL-1]
MKKIFALLVVAMLSGALAQGRVFGEVATGNLNMVPNFSLGVSARAGAEDVLGPLALRGGFTLNTSSGGTTFGLGADALFFLRGVSPTFYFGGGLGLQSAGNNTTFSLGFPVGVELPVTRDFNFIAELQPVLNFTGGQSQFTLALQVGPRLYFR